MKCPKCGKEYETLACADCLWLASRQSYLDLQLRFLPDVLARRLHLRLASTNRNRGPWHIELFDEPSHGYCGVPTAYLARERKAYRPELRQSLCPFCLEQFDLCARKATAAATP